MAARICTQGLMRIARQASQSTNYSATRHIQTGSVDDSANAIAAGDTAANSGGAITNFFAKALASTPTETAPAVITHLITLTALEYLFTVKRVLLHDQPASLPVISSTASLVGGVDGQSLVHGAYILTLTLTITYSNV